MKIPYYYYVIVLIITLFNDLFSQDMPMKVNKEDIEINSDIAALVVKEISVKGTRHNLIRKGEILHYEYVKNNYSGLNLKFYRSQGMNTTYDYDKDNNVKSIINTYAKNNTPSGKTLYFYDTNGNPTYELTYSKNGKLIDSAVVEYNKAKNHIKKKHYSPTDKMFKTEEFWRNLKNKEIKNLQSVGGSTTTLVYEYDNTQTKLINERWYLNNKLVQNIKYNYNDKGILISKIESDEKGERATLTEYEYDMLSGLPVVIKTSDHITSYEYNFDEKNNWTTRYEFYDDYPVKITERTITY